jgi:CrcB protein
MVAGGSLKDGFPVATFVVNIGGSLLLGLLGALVTRRMVGAPEVFQLGLGVGFLGAFTTFSTFEAETHWLVDDGQWLVAALYIAVSVLAGLFAVRVGVTLGSTW